MTDRPIIFSAPMIRALLDGRKTQTRRVLKPQPSARLPIGGAEFVVMGDDPGRWCWLNGYDGSILAPFEARYATGDRLWVKEAFIAGYDSDENGELLLGPKRVWYRATDGGLSWYDHDTESTIDNPPWKPPIHMPRWASRITLLVDDVLVQRVQDISEADARAEGAISEEWDEWREDVRAIASEATTIQTERDVFAGLWNSLHGSGAWDRNDWVAALTFRVVLGNIDGAA